MDALRKRVQKLVSVDPKDLKLRSVRSVLRNNRDELGHIKTVGKGRNKAAIMEDLKQWLKKPEEEELVFVVNPTGCYEMNYLIGEHGAEDMAIKAFLPEQEQHFAELMLSESVDNGRFVSWEDLEERVEGFDRKMILDHHQCDLYFDDECKEQNARLVQW